MADIKGSTTGTLNYPKLKKLALHCLLVLPGNSDPERDFSINKNILKVHGYSTKKDTLTALCFIKDVLILTGGQFRKSSPERGFLINWNILEVHGYSIKEDKLTALCFIKDVLILTEGHRKIHLFKDLFSSCRGAISSYVAFKVQKLEEQMEKRKINEEAEQKKAKEKDKKSVVLKHLEGDLDLLHAGIKVAENTAEEGKTDFGEVMAKKPLDINKIKMHVEGIGTPKRCKSKTHIQKFGKIVIFFI